MEHLGLVAIKDRAWSALRMLPGVHAVGVGTKETAGYRSTSPCIIVFVSKKRARQYLRLCDLVPSSLEGIATDVVEMACPRLSSATPTVPGLAPSPLTVTVSSPLSAGASTVVTLITTIDPVPQGFMVVLCVTVTRPGKEPKHLVSQIPTDGKHTLEEILTAMTIFAASDLGVAVQNPPGTKTVVIHPDINNSASVDCYILTLDTFPYRLVSVRGGICIYGEEAGTLGCIATSKPTPAFPQGRIFALTCEHVVATPRNQATNLFGLVSADSATITMNNATSLHQHPDPVTRGSLVLVGFFRGKSLRAIVFYRTAKNSTLSVVALGVADAVNTGTVPGITAIQSKTIPEVVEIVGANANNDYVLCTTFGPTLRDPKCLLKVTSAQVGADITLTFSGNVSTKYRYGVFIHVNPIGTLATFGIFVDATGKTLDEIALAASSAINAVAVPVRGTVTSPPSARSETIIQNVANVEFFVERDMRVGQPANSYSWPCSNEIGHVADAHVDVDAAVIQLDPGVNYTNVIEGLGAINGPVAAATIGMAVAKRGFVSGITSGKIVALSTTGFVVSSTGFRRSYSNALLVESTEINAGQGTTKPFMVSGDSGSALVTAGTDPRQIVGLLFAASDGITALAVPIEQVIDAFPKLNLSFALSPGEDPNAVKIVPASAENFQRHRSVRASLLTFPRHGPAFGFGSFGFRVRQAERKIQATVIGRTYAQVIRRHLAEAQELINNHRRIGAAWQRSGGPEVTASLVETICIRRHRLPLEINGKPFAECIEKLVQTLSSHASVAFARDLQLYASRMTKCSGLTYTEMIRTLQNPYTD